MNPEDIYIKRGKIILSISMLFLMIAIVIFSIENTNTLNTKYELSYETIDIKTMGVAKVSLKKTKEDSADKTIFTSKKDSILTEITLEDTATLAKKEEITTTISNEAAPQKPIWRLPTEQGRITQYAHFGHIALDITSARGTNEIIYPVADGIITSIYHDNYGAKIVTINHYIGGQYYTSQYVHLSWFAPGLNVGQPVTTDTALGGMGATGIATGIHLHLTVMDCNLYSPNDPNCSTLGKFYNYGRSRVLQGFKGLDSIISVPYSWYSR